MPNANPRRSYNDINSDIKDLWSNAIPICSIIDGLIYASKKGGDEGLHHQFLPFVWTYRELLDIVWENYKPLNEEVEGESSRDEKFDGDRRLHKMLLAVRCAHTRADHMRRSLPDINRSRMRDADMARIETEEAMHSIEVRAKRLGEHLDHLEAIFNPFIKANEFSAHLDWKYCAKIMGVVSEILDFLQRERASIVSVVGSANPHLDAVDAENRISTLKSGWDELIDRFKALNAAFSESEE